MNSSFKLLLYIMKLNLKRINSFVVSILLTSCENQQLKLSWWGLEESELPWQQHVL